MAARERHFNICSGITSTIPARAIFDGEIAHFGNGGRPVHSIQYGGGHHSTYCATFTDCHHWPLERKRQLQQLRRGSRR